MKKLVLMLAVLTLFGASCIQFGPAKSNIGGGVYQSANKGADWVEKNIAPTANGVGTIAGIDILNLVQDPQDTQAIYLTSAGTGLFYTWDGAESWNYVESLGSGYINSIAIDYKNKCVLYAATQNRIMKSEDCGRSWVSKYFDTRPEIFVSYLAVDTKNSNILYAGLSKGDLLKSTNGGEGWNTINRFSAKIIKLLVNPNNSNIILAGIENNGLWKSENGGKTWKDLREKTKEFRGSDQVYNIVETNGASTIYLSSNYGLIRSDNFGESWSVVELLTPPGAVRIYGVATNPNNANELYYSTASTFYSSSDGGKNWTTRKLPTAKAGSALLVNQKDGNVLYLGTKLIK